MNAPVNAIQPLSPASTLSLPNEVLLHILTFLDARDIVRFSATNKTFFELYNESSLLQSLVQLDICGADACLGPPNLGPRARLAYMMTRESLWLQIHNPPVVTRRSDPGPSLGLSDVDEGVFWFASGTFGGENPSNMTSGARAVKALQFSQDTEQIPWRTFAVGDESLVVHACLAIQEHDLIAIFTIPLLSNGNPGTEVKLRLHLFQFSTGHPHPLALSHIIDIQQMEVYEFHYHFISAAISGRKIFVHCPRLTVVDILGNFPGVGEESYLLVFDWMTGDCLLSICQSFSIDSFILLPGDVIVTSNKIHGRLEFSRLAQSNTSGRWIIEQFAHLELPHTSPGSRYNQITFRSHHKSNGPLNNDASTEPQLIFSPVKGLFTIILHLWGRHGGQFYLATIHTEDLLRCAGVFGDTGLFLLSQGGIATVPWSQWGAKYAHFERVHEGWWDKMVDTFGHRQALLMPRPSGHGNELFMRDYNPISVRYYLSNPSNYNFEVFMGERSCNRGSYFEEDVIFSLPFVQTVGIPRPLSDEHLYMDRDHLVVLSQSEASFIELFVATFKPHYGSE